MGCRWRADRRFLRHWADRRCPEVTSPNGNRMDNWRLPEGSGCQIRSQTPCVRLQHHHTYLLQWRLGWRLGDGWEFADRSRHRRRHLGSVRLTGNAGFLPELKAGWGGRFPLMGISSAMPLNLPQLRGDSDLCCYETGLEVDIGDTTNGPWTNWGFEAFKKGKQGLMPRLYSICSVACHSKSYHYRLD